MLAALVVLGVIATPASAATQVVRWSPFIDAALRPGLVATPAFGGDCFTGSFAVHNAYRCANGNFLRDPCFADPTRATPCSVSVTRSRAGSSACA